MEPIPETVEAVEEYGPFGSDDVDLIAELRERGLRVQELVPDCIGYSLESEKHGATFTLVTDDLDVKALLEEHHLEPAGLDRDDLLDEDAWQRSGRASAAEGVRSTLTLPVMTGDRVVGSVTLYASSGAAFSGHHEEVAALFDAWAPGAVTNADLSFTTLSEARRAPQLLKDEVTLQVAVGILVVRDGLDVQVAERTLRDASVRAGVSLQDLANAVLEANRHSSKDQ